MSVSLYLRDHLTAAKILAIKLHLQDQHTHTDTDWPGEAFPPDADVFLKNKETTVKDDNRQSVVWECKTLFSLF